MRLRVGYSPWQGWDCWLVMPMPTGSLGVICWLERWAARFEGWPTVREPIWRVRTALYAVAKRWQGRRGDPVWWEYRAA